MSTFVTDAHLEHQNAGGGWNQIAASRAFSPQLRAIIKRKKKKKYRRVRRHRGDAYGRGKQMQTPQVVVFTASGAGGFELIWKFKCLVLGACKKQVDGDV